MIIKDSMVLIHLAKITLLEKSCDYFRHTIIPFEVYNEILKGKEKGYEDAQLIENLIKMKKITLKEVKMKKFIEKANEFNIFKGEAEAVALYWQEDAQYLATDDDNVRKKSHILNINLIGTPSIILKLRKEKLIEKDKFIESLEKLRKIGWFNNMIIDKIKLEAE